MANPTYADPSPGSEAMQKADRKWLDRNADLYPFRVVGPLTIRGEEGEAFGDCVSRNIPLGKRTWAFETMHARDAFAAANGLYIERRPGIGIRVQSDGGGVWGRI